MGVLFRLARRPAPQPKGRGFVVVGVGEGARGALGHRVGVRNPGQGPANVYNPFGVQLYLY